MMKIRKQLLSYFLIMAVLVTTVGSGINVSRAAEDEAPIDTFVEETACGALASAELNYNMKYENLGKTPVGTQGTSRVTFIREGLTGVKGVLSESANKVDFYKLTLTVNSNSTDVFCGAIGKHVHTGDTYERVESLDLNYEWTEKVLKAAISKHKACTLSHYDANALQVWYAAIQIVVWRALYLDKVGYDGKDFYSGELKSIVEQVCESISYNNLKDLEDCISSIYKDINNVNLDGVELYRWKNITREDGQPFYTINDTIGAENIKGRFEVNKISNTDGTGLPGAVFGIYNDTGCNNCLCKMTTDANGYAISDYVDGGTNVFKASFYVKEIEAPEGYTLNETVFGPYTIENNDDLIHVNDGNGVPNSPKTLKIILHKVDSDTKKPLSGVKFELFERNSKNQYVSTGNYLKEVSAGKYETGDLAYTKNNKGKFLIKEVQGAGEHYINANWSKKYEIKLDGDGKQTTEDTVENTPQYGRISLKKVDSKTGDALDDCVFGIYEEKNNNGTVNENSKVGEIKTDSDGNAISDKLPVGKTYYVKEIKARKGYSVNNTVYTVKIKKTQNGSSDAGIFPINSGKAVKNEPWSGTIKLRKKSSVDGTLLDGAEFEIYEWNNKTNKYDTKVDKVYEDCKTDSSAMAGIYTSKTLHYSLTNEGKFKVIETKAPNRFVKDFEKEFVISDTQIDKKTIVVPVKSVLELDALNKPSGGYIEIYKVGRQTGLPIKNAKYGIYKDSACKNSIGTMTTNDKGHAKYSEMLEPGMYYVKEIAKDNKANAYINDEVYTAVVKSGETTRVGVQMTYSGKSGVYVTDYEWGLPVEISKTDKNTKEPLKGVTFSIYEYSNVSKVYKKTPIQTITTDKSGVAKSTDLYYTDKNEGKFKIVETGWADADYEAHGKANPFTKKFSIVGPDGKADKDKHIYTAPSNYNDTTKTIHFDVTNKKTGVWIALYKIGNFSKKPLPGVKFGVYGENDSECSGKPIDTIVTNDDGYGITSKDLKAEATYYVKEIKEKGSPYEYNDYIYTVDIGSDDSNKVILVGDSGRDEQQVDWINDEKLGQIPRIKNNEKAINIQVAKVASLETEEPLLGAEFTLYEWNADIKGYDMSNGTVLVGDEAGVYAYEKLVYTKENEGKFKIVETKAPDKYIPSEKEFEFNIIDLFDETFEAEKGACYTVEYEQTLTPDEPDTVIITIENKPVTGSLIGNKVDSVSLEAVPQGDASLENAEFTIFAAEDIANPKNPNETLYKTDQEVAKATTNKEGQFRIDNLPIAKYYVQETKAPVGYRIDVDMSIGKARKYSCDLTEVYKQQYDEYMAAVSRGEDVEVIKQIEYTDTYKETVEQKPFSIHKTGLIGNKRVNLEGVGFQAYLISDLEKDSNGEYKLEPSKAVRISDSEESPYEIFTDSEGNASSIEIPYGEYLIVESTVPEGFAETQPQTIKISDSAETDELKLEFINIAKTVAIRIVKRDKSTGQVIKEAGVTFKITDEDGNIYSFVSKDKNGNDVSVNEFKTNENGEATIPGLSMGTYEITEISAPSGYSNELEGKKVTLAMDSEYLVDSETGDDILVVDFYDDTIDVKIKKTDITTGEEILGAHLEVRDSNGNLFDSWVSDGSEHLISGIPVGKYTLVETLAPEDNGYVKSEAVEFEVVDDKVVHTVEMKDDYTKVDISKLDFADSCEIEGATLTVYRVISDADGNIIQNSDGSFRKGSQVVSFVTDGTPHRIERMAPGMYILEETNNPEWYEKAESILFEVKSDSSIQSVKMYDKAKTGAITVNKVDAADKNKSLEGAEFEVTNDKGESVGTIVTKENGYGELSGLVMARMSEGKLDEFITYTVTEIKAPVGYEITEEPKTFKFSDDNKVVNNVVSLTFEDESIQPPKASLNVTKQDAANGNTLAGAEFEVTDGNGTLVGTIVTDENGKGSLEELTVCTIKGSELGDFIKYTVTETKAPYGYEITEEPKTFTFEGKDEPLTVMELTFEDTKIESPVASINVTKQDAANGNTLAGAEFEVTDGNGTLVGTIVTDENGKGSLDNIIVGVMNDKKNVIDEYISYTVTETKAPHGYEITEEPKTFTFEGKDKPLTVMELTFEDTKIESPVGNIEVEKTDSATGELLAGAEFKVTDENGALVGTIVTDETGKGSLDNIVVGIMNETTNTVKRYITYTVTETKAPYGYEITEEPKTFTFEDDGTFKEYVQLSFSDRKYDCPVGKINVTKLDEETELKHLAGAEFDVTDENGTLVGTIVTDESGTGSIDNLPYGELDGETGLISKYFVYTVTETVAPIGYEITEEPKTFTFEDADELNVVNMMFTDKKVKSPKGRIVVNKVADKTLYKLAGAEFEVTDSKGKLVGTIVTDENGAGSLEDLKIGTFEDDGTTVKKFETYTITETKAPVGYEITEEPKTFTFEGKEGKVKSVVTMTFKDTVYECPVGKVEVIKVDTDNEELYLKGAEFEVTDGNGDVIGTMVTDENGYAYIDNLPYGTLDENDGSISEYYTYTVTETKAPVGYEITEEPKTFTFENADDNRVIKLVFKDTAYECPFGKLEVIKVDNLDDKVVLKDAEFEVTDGNGDVIGTMVTDENGYAYIDNLPFGTLDENDGSISEYYTYTVTETKAPEGYEITEEPKTFTFENVDDNRVIKLVFKDKKFMQVYGRIGFIKTGDMVTGTTEIDTDYGKQYHIDFKEQALPNVTFGIFKDKDCKDNVEYVTTDENDVVYSTELELGTYYVKETDTPNGYVPDKDVHKVVITDEGIENAKIIDVSYECVNHMCSVKIRVYKEGEKLKAKDGKFDLSDRIKLKGVVFGIYTNEDIKDYSDKTIVKKDSLVSIIKTNDKGIATMEGTLPAGKYYYMELETLYGYELDDEKHEFEVSLGNNELEEIDVNKQEPLLNKLSTPTKVRLCKKDTATGAVLDDVEFELYTSADELIGTYVTDKEGVIEVEGLPYGTYYFVETRAQSHYILTKKAIKFTIDGESDVDLDVSAFNQRLVIPRLGFMDANNALVIGLLIIAFAAAFTISVLVVFRKKRRRN